MVKLLILNALLNMSISRQQVLDSVLCDLNNDGCKDKILVETGPKFTILKGAPGGRFTLWYSNERLLLPDEKCAADGYQKLVVKGGYITIESSICSGWLYVHQFITFHYDKKTTNIVLHKYVEAYTDRTNPDKEIPEVTYPLSRIKPKKFNEVTDSYITTIRQKNNSK